MTTQSLNKQGTRVPPPRTFHSPGKVGESRNWILKPDIFTVPRGGDLLHAEKETKAVSQQRAVHGFHAQLVYFYQSPSYKSDPMHAMCGVLKDLLPLPEEVHLDS